MVFISHANPEENEFARWLTLQLANEGYPVWCDVTKLLGGENFWENIQDAIANRTAKFIFALTRASNEKEGTLDELSCALNIERQLGAERFVVTLKLDDLPYEDVYIKIQRRNHIDFRQSWASGLAQLLKKMADDRVPRRPNFNPQAVCTWWRSRSEFSAEQGLVRERDEHLSNWFPICGTPDLLYRHMVTRAGIGKIEFEATTFAWPAVKDTELSFLSFAKAEDFEGGLPPHLSIEHTSEVAVRNVLERTAPLGYPARLTQLLRMAWERAMEGTKLRVYEHSDRAKCFYFIRGIVENDRLFFMDFDGKRRYRDVIGHSTRMEHIRYWHYGINAKPALYPKPHYVVKGHVLFSNDAITLWMSKDKLAKARRSQCRNWWNDEWRDRLLAVMTYLADEQGVFSIPVASDRALTISRLPEVFGSPVSYIDLRDTAEGGEQDDHAFEDEDEEEGEFGDENDR